MTLALLLIRSTMKKYATLGSVSCNELSQFACLMLPAVVARKSILEKPADAMTMEEIEAIQSSEQPQAAQSSDAQVEEEEAEDEGIPLSVELAAPAMKPVDLVQAVVEPEEEVKEKRTAKRQMRTNWGRSKIEKKSATTTTSSSASLSEVAADVASSSSAPVGSL